MGQYILETDQSSFCPSTNLIAKSNQFSNEKRGAMWQWLRLNFRVYHTEWSSDKIWLWADKKTSVQQGRYGEKTSDLICLVVKTKQTLFPPPAELYLDTAKAKKYQRRQQYLAFNVPSQKQIGRARVTCIKGTRVKIIGCFLHSIVHIALKQTTSPT